MGKIKTVRFGKIDQWQGLDQLDGKIKSEWVGLEQIEDLVYSQKVVTITVRNEETGEEWVFDKVKLVEKEGRVRGN